MTAGPPDDVAQRLRRYQRRFVLRNLINLASVVTMIVMVCVLRDSVVPLVVWGTLAALAVIAFVKIGPRLKLWPFPPREPAPQDLRTWYGTMIRAGSAGDGLTYGFSLVGAGVVALPALLVIGPLLWDLWTAGTTDWAEGAPFLPLFVIGGSMLWEMIDRQRQRTRYDAEEAVGTASGGER